MSYRSNPRTEAARHYCRATGCAFSAGPGPRAHQAVREHRMTVHGFKAIVSYCNAECGYRARPSEGRYTVQPLMTTTWLATGPTEVQP